MKVHQPYGFVLVDETAREIPSLASSTARHTQRQLLPSDTSALQLSMSTQLMQTIQQVHSLLNQPKNDD